MSTEVLAARYAALNETWFDGRLPPVGFRVSRRMTSTAGQYVDPPGEITVAQRYLDAFPEKVDELLLHEMVHVATRSGHGRAFRREWHRLLDLGAPVPPDYGEFRHCPAFAAPRARPYRYRCPACGHEFSRTRPFREARWCLACATRARRRGLDPFADDRRLAEVLPAPVQERLFGGCGGEHEAGALADVSSRRAPAYRADPHS